jgi:hypothetical protein
MNEATICSEGTSFFEICSVESDYLQTKYFYKYNICCWEDAIMTLDLGFQCF